MLDIDRSPFFQILLLVNLIARPFARLYADRYDISVAEWRLMLVLARRPSLTANDLCDMLGLDKMAISRAVRSLEKHGRLARAADPADLRRFTLSLTPDGLALYHVIAPSGHERQEALLSALQPTERAALDAILEKLVARARSMPDPGQKP
jgi:DNA-binding MarR family transcriptional regulator